MINIDVKLNIDNLIKVIDGSENDVLNVLNIFNNEEVVRLLIKNMSYNDHKGLEVLIKVYRNSGKTQNWWKDFKTTLRDLTFNEIAMFVCNTIGTNEEYFEVVDINSKKTEFEEFLETIGYDFNNRPFSEYLKAFEDFPLLPKLIKLVIDKCGPEKLLDTNLLKETYCDFNEYLDLFKDYEFPQSNDIDLKRFQTFINGLKNTSGEKTLHRITNLFNKLKFAEFQQVMIDAGFFDMEIIEKTLDELVKEKEEINSKINQLLKIKTNHCLSLINIKGEENGNQN
jgi:hypothetical protein